MKLKKKRKSKTVEQKSTKKEQTNRSNTSTKRN